MIKTTVKVDGMMCGMCESHVNDAVRKVFQVDKVTSSHSKGETVIISEKPVDEAKLKTAISATGYEVKGISSEPYEKKKGLFSLNCCSKGPKFKTTLSNFVCPKSGIKIASKVKASLIPYLISNPPFNSPFVF